MAKATSDKGIRTKNKIIQIAKSEFYHKGFAKTSIKEICKQVEIRTGTFAYYFKTKEDLLKAIYAELHMRTYAFVDNHVNEKINSIEKNTYSAYLYYTAVFIDEETIRFHSETLKRESIQMFLGQNFRHVYRQFVNDSSYGIDNNELHALSLADLGMRREVVLDFLENPNTDETLYDLIRRLYLYRSRLFKIDEIQMRAYLFNGQLFERKHDHSEIRLLL